VLDIVFWVLAIVAVLAALAVLILRDVFRAAMALILLFLTIAAIYVTLSADFLAVVQILIYVGAISILIIVGIMLTQNVKQGNPSGRLVIPARQAGYTGTGNRHNAGNNTGAEHKPYLLEYQQRGTGTKHHSTAGTVDVRAGGLPLPG